jgi:hypothetical protein
VLASYFPPFLGETISQKHFEQRLIRDVALARLQPEIFEHTDGQA